MKNNLQTVAALLRLQARRLARADEAARAALEEAERRVGSIALVHETLSRTLDEHVDFDEIADRVGCSGRFGDNRPRVTAGDRCRSCGTARSAGWSAEVATPLALVLIELVQNAVEHGLGDAGGTVRVEVRRGFGHITAGVNPPSGETLVVTVSDDGPGPTPASTWRRTPAASGLQIVRTLVETELGGEMSLLPVAELPRGRSAGCHGVGRRGCDGVGRRWCADPGVDTAAGAARRLTRRLSRRFSDRNP